MSGDEPGTEDGLRKRIVSLEHQRAALRDERNSLRAEHEKVVAERDALARAAETVFTKEAAGEMVASLRAQLNAALRDNERMRMLYEVVPPEKDAVALLFEARARIAELERERDEARYWLINGKPDIALRALGTTTSTEPTEAE